MVWRVSGRVGGRVSGYSQTFANSSESLTSGHAGAAISSLGPFACDTTCARWFTPRWPAGWTHTHKRLSVFHKPVIAI